MAKFHSSKQKKTIWTGVENILSEERQFSESKVLERCNWISNRFFLFLGSCQELWKRPLVTFQSKDVSNHQYHLGVINLVWSKGPFRADWKERRCWDPTAAQGAAPNVLYWKVNVQKGEQDEKMQTIKGLWSFSKLSLYIRMWTPDREVKYYIEQY